MGCSSNTNTSKSLLKMAKGTNRRITMFDNESHWALQKTSLASKLIVKDTILKQCLHICNQNFDKRKYYKCVQCSEDDWMVWNFHYDPSSIQDNIFRKLEIIQATTTLIDPGCSVWDEYGIQRSGRRFFTTRCTNVKVDKHDIELQCRWSTDRANGVRTVQRSMIHNYSEVRNMKQALIRPSKACWQSGTVDLGLSPAGRGSHECWDNLGKMSKQKITTHTLTEIQLIIRKINRRAAVIFTHNFLHRFA